MDTPAVQAAQEPHPIKLVVTDDLRRNRLTAFFRLALWLPQLAGN